MGEIRSLWADMETPLVQAPDFYVQAPDGARQWSEIDRQQMLFNLMRSAAPRVLGFAIPNAGKRNPSKAKKEGIMGGVFDTQWCWQDGLTAFVEMKGYSASTNRITGKVTYSAGALEKNQIDWGNRMVALGHHVACFFDPYAAVAWLRDRGFPVRQVVR